MAGSWAVLERVRSSFPIHDFHPPAALVDWASEMTAAKQAIHFSQWIVGGPLIAFRLAFSIGLIAVGVRSRNLKVSTLRNFFFVGSAFALVAGANELWFDIRCLALIFQQQDMSIEAQWQALFFLVSVIFCGAVCMVWMLVQLVIFLTIALRLRDSDHDNVAAKD